MGKQGGVKIPETNQNVYVGQSPARWVSSYRQTQLHTFPLSHMTYMGLWSLTCLRPGDANYWLLQTLMTGFTTILMRHMAEPSSGCVRTVVFTANMLTSLKDFWSADSLITELWNIYKQTCKSVLKTLSYIRWGNLGFSQSEAWRSYLPISTSSTPLPSSLHPPSCSPLFYLHIHLFLSINLPAHVSFRPQLFH